MTRRFANGAMSLRMIPRRTPMMTDPKSPSALPPLAAAALALVLGLTLVVEAIARATH